MAACTNLELLRLAANRFEHLPEWLFSLPRLAWLAYAGNPCSDAAETAAMAQQPISHIDWYTLQLQEKLGEGASGVIYRATPRSDEGPPVAVKVFKGGLTSDGLPRSEKAACIAAGAHPGLIPVAGKISGHPEGTPGLVMSLIHPTFTNLAGPPSLESCTRDIYPAETRFTLQTVLNLALGIAEVAEHLHAQGLMHGDLYAHNILRNEQGECLLGDFGATSFVPQQDARLAASLQRIEVRAFACLLKELLDRCTAQRETQHIIDALRDLQCRCDQPQANARPLFDEIRQILTALQKELAGNQAVPII
jgi:serine/threonine protein kinase